MQPIIDRILANNFADFEGMEIKGTIPIQEALANELITTYMNEFFAETASKKSTKESSSYIQALKTLQPNRFEIAFEAGKAIISFELKR